MPYLTANATFSGVGFLLTSDGLSDSREAMTSEEVVPWGTYRIIQIGARGIRTVKGVAYFEDQTTLESFFALIGTEATLMLDWTGPLNFTAVLKSAEQGGEYWADSVVAASVVFLIAED